jgi:hypothetical protein
LHRRHDAPVPFGVEQVVCSKTQIEYVAGFDAIGIVVVVFGAGLR